jgi:hypothetical protein
MKKKNLKSLKLNKSSISNLNKERLNGGTSITFTFTFTLGDDEVCDIFFPPGTVENCTYAIPCDPDYTKDLQCENDSKNILCN